MIKGTPKPPSATYELMVLAERLAILRLPGGAPLPDWVQIDAPRFCCITRTPDELSIVVDQNVVPRDQAGLRDYRALRVAGTLDPQAVGVLASITAPLASARIPIFAISTFDTDYILVRERDLDRAIEALLSAGHRVVR
jgi:hypothetical protein